MSEYPIQYCCSFRDGMGAVAEDCLYCADMEAAYEKAKEHNDAARMQTEQVKLDVVREVRAEFDQIWEGAE